MSLNTSPPANKLHGAINSQTVTNRTTAKSSASNLKSATRSRTKPGQVHKTIGPPAQPRRSSRLAPKSLTADVSSPPHERRMEQARSGGAVLGYFAILHCSRFQKRATVAVCSATTSGKQRVEDDKTDTAAGTRQKLGGALTTIKKTSRRRPSGGSSTSRSTRTNHDGVDSLKTAINPSTGGHVWFYIINQHEWDASKVSPRPTKGRYTLLSRPISARTSILTSQISRLEKLTTKAVTRKGRKWCRTPRRVGPTGRT